MLVKKNVGQKKVWSKKFGKKIVKNFFQKKIAPDDQKMQNIGCELPIWPRKGHLFAHNSKKLSTF